MSDFAPGSICAIVPTYNRAAMLRSCIDSILAQSRPVAELIVVNDGSTDGTQSVIRAYGDRVTLLTKPNGGKASALNLALTHCSSDYVWICDDDDIAAPDGVRPLAEILDAHPLFDLALGGYAAFRDESGKRIFSDPGQPPIAEEPSFRLLFFECMAVPLNAMLVRRSFYAGVGPFSEEFIRSEDYEMAVRLMRHGHVQYVPHMVYYYRHHEDMRGTATDRIPSSEDAQRTLAYDQKLFLYIREQYNLGEFTPTFADGWDVERACRAALIERACVTARRALWGEAIADLREAIAYDGFPVTPQEIRLAERIISPYLPWMFLSRNSGWIEELHACYAANECGCRIIYAVCRPLLRHARERMLQGDPAGSASMVRVLSRILGVRGAYSRALSTLAD